MTVPKRSSKKTRAADAQKQRIVNHIESIIQAYTKAINDRVAWDDPLYRGTVDIENFTGTAPRTNTSWRDFGDSVDLVVKQFPEYHIRISSIETNIDVKEGSSTSVVNTELTGAPVGVARRGVAVFRFQRRLGGGDDEGSGALKWGSWQCVGRELLEESQVESEE